MAEYMIRIVLHGADGEEYDQLHEEMEAAGASRSIRADDGKLYDLPNAEYYLETERLGADVRDIVVEIAAAIRPDPSVLVCKATAFFWRLQPVPGRS